MSEQKHTPTPWIVHAYFQSVVVPESDAKKQIGCHIDPDREAERHAKVILWYEGSEYPEFHRSRVMRDEAKANAEFIVRAVNAHAELVAALEKIERWDNFPPSGRFYPHGEEMSYGAAFGSNGERDYMRSVASAALAKVKV